MAHSTPKIIYISWAPYCSRSDNTARELGGNSYMVYCEFLGSNYVTILLKYLLQTIWTFYVFAKERPDVVFIMSPPVFANIPVFVYCQFFGKKYVIDAHTGAFDSPLWENVKFLQKFFIRKALFTIITNDNIAEQVYKWGGEGLIVPDVPIRCNTINKPIFEKKINITLVNSFAKDEPLDIFLESTKGFKENVQFYVTGKITTNVSAFVSNAGLNVKFTDFLSNENYYGLLSASTLVVVLTTRENTMQRGAYEAIYFGTPIITSNKIVLKNNFPIGAMFVENTSEDITRGIREGLDKISLLKSEADELRCNKSVNWENTKKRIFERIMR